MSDIRPFHLAIPVVDLDKCREFYRETMSCTEGRSDSKWVDFDFYGHQLVIHQVPALPANADQQRNPVDGKQVPVPHFGVVLSWEEWNKLADRLKSLQITFLIEPCIRFEGLPGEQATMFFLDPEGNALEFKAFKDINRLFHK
ncbi:VOC family protein [Reichenbachiella carrageenanivorans]|uniref:VOC family protein n=1 Tax=Reichenbachiella carrageenanivorans TaxID=2979869 RepID=A0ABY6D131_9BACT|nr:VOC family protein [Reichenbachiella carrageenanivorans]UXX79867.1 VOC family protein [Reichenbachiella carrageenanivorans]